MAFSRCSNCQNNNWNLVEKTVGAAQLYFVQCSACGTVVGVLNYENAGAMLFDVLASLGRIENALNRLRLAS